ncbi:MAG TPA: TldD/PmbA family protein [Saccharofermentans sp.]|nr:TldD/PmbA family protein [Saccharofermentans sp.]
MDISAAKQFMKRLIDKSTSYGFEEAECCFMQDYSMSVDILNQEVSSYENSNEQGISFRGKVKGQMGYASTTSFEDRAIDFLLKEAYENCLVLDDEDEEFVYCDDNDKELFHDQTTPSFSKNTCASFSVVGLSLEKALKDIDPRVTAVDYLSISCGAGPVIVMNSKGLSSYKDSDYISIFAEARATSEGVVKTAGNYWFGNDVDLFDEKKFVDVLGKKLLGKFGASSIKSGTYDIILGNEAFISLLSTFFGSFSSFNMQKGLSLLADKEGTVIASEALTLSEEPMLDKALLKIPFDSEGVRTKSKNIINKGKFETALYNTKTARKANRQSTGNGFRSSYASSVGILTTNIVIKPDSLDLEGLCKEVNNGIYITDLNGLHAGVNAISGDFSLQSEGYLIKDGLLVRPIEQITVADNFFEILKKIRVVGNDVINYPVDMGEFFSPSIVIDSVSVSGDE